MIHHDPSHDVPNGLGLPADAGGAGVEAPSSRRHGSRRVFSRCVSELMTPAPIRFDARTSVRDAERHLARRSRPIHHLLVTRDKALCGVLCLCELWSAPPGATLAECLHGSVATLSPMHTVRDAIRRMRELGVGALPILREGTLVGLVTRGDLARAGVPMSLLGPVCAGCGTHHHVKAMADASSPAFCSSCLGVDERSAPYHELYEDLGVGD